MSLKTVQRDRVAIEPSTFAAAAVALLLGLLLVLGIGFLQPSALHNAAHDVRHAVAFPCH